MKKIRKFVIALLTLSLALNVFFLPASAINAYTLGDATLIVTDYYGYNTFNYAYASTTSSYGACSVGLQVTIYDPLYGTTYQDGTNGYSDLGFATCNLTTGSTGCVITSALSYHWSVNQGYMGITWDPLNGYQRYN